MAAACKTQQLGRTLAAALAPAGRHGSSFCCLQIQQIGSQTSSLWLQQQSPLRALASSAAVAASGTTQPADQQPSNEAATSSSSSTASQASSSTGSTGTGSSAAADSSAGDADGYRVMYQGFFGRPHKRLKYASLLNTFASFAAAPLIISYSSASPVARVAVTVSVLTFAIITTGGLHWFTSPYIHQLLFNDKTDTAKVQTLSFLGGTKWHEFPVSTVQPATGYHPLATFKVLGKTFYLDKANFADADLLARLSPGSSESSESSTSIQADD